VTIPPEVADELLVALDVRFDSIKLPLGDLLEVQPGAILTMGGSEVARVLLLAGSEAIARGEIVTTDDGAAIRIVEMLGSRSPAEG
jgi:flagellar motor switch/type III secretory pathway protein FliN